MPSLPLPDRAVAQALVRFLLVGGLATAVDVGLFNVLHVGGHVDPILAKTASTVVSAVVAYVGNRQWAFRAAANLDPATELVRYVVANALSLLVALVPIWVAKSALGLHGALAMNVAANVVGLGLATGFRFVAYRRWVFPAAAQPRVRRVGELEPAGAAGL